ncbi:hypothetical protein ACHHYP_03770 [Achlya hypogyna]|uniref:EF-hand domain-containing protein n=1 Tax=Achlya hypogyna TaxID=1202772 RepID=A0A1V9ZPN8_ACHHY|nr:hypothetical protein ACHHYP_03770 [Achlya hypogyna]
MHIADLPRMADLTVFRVRRDLHDVGTIARSTQYTLHKARLEIERRPPPSYMFVFPAVQTETLTSPRGNNALPSTDATSPPRKLPSTSAPTTTLTPTPPPPHGQRYPFLYENVKELDPGAKPKPKLKPAPRKPRHHQKSTRQPQLSCPLPINPIEPKERLLQHQDISEFDLRVCHSPEAVTRFHGHLSDHNIEALMHQTGFTRLELYTLWSRFKALCSLSRSPAGVDQATFRRAVPLLSVEDEMFVDRVFAILDEDYSGVIEWREFIRAMSALEKGDLRARIVFLFQVYDLNGDGKLSRDELITFFISGLMVSSDDANVQEMAHHFADEIMLALGVPQADLVATVSVMEVTTFIERAKMEDIYSIFGRTMLNELDKQIPKADPDLESLEDLEHTSIVYRTAHLVMDKI